MSGYLFVNTIVTRSVGIGHTLLGYLRLTYVPFARWKSNAEWYRGWRPVHTCDNAGALWRGWSWRPIQAWGELAAFRYYRLTATHVSVGPFTVSYVNDREGWGPVGPVWPRNARDRVGVRVWRRL